MRKNTLSASRQSHKCPFCQKQFYLMETLQSHKPQCILGKTLKRPPLNKPMSAAKRTNPLEQNSAEVRTCSKQKFRVKKLGNTTMNTISSWNTEQKSNNLTISKKKIEKNQDFIKKQKIDIFTDQKTQTKQKHHIKQQFIKLQSKQQIIKSLKSLQNNNTLEFSISYALINIQIQWPIEVDIYIDQLSKIQQSLKESEKEFQICQRFQKLRHQTLLKIKQKLVQKQSYCQPFVTERPQSRSSKVTTNRVENFTLSICPYCIGQLDFGEQVIQLQCQHRYHQNCWQKIKNDQLCIACTE